MFKKTAILGRTLHSPEQGQYMEKASPSMVRGLKVFRFHDFETVLKLIRETSLKRESAEVFFSLKDNMEAAYLDKEIGIFFPSPSVTDTKPIPFRTTSTPACLAPLVFSVKRS